MTGRSRALPRTRQFDPLLPFTIGPMNGREARESGLRPTAVLLAPVSEREDSTAKQLLRTQKEGGD